MVRFTRTTRLLSMAAGTALLATLAAAPRAVQAKTQDTREQTAPKHHSKAKGAIVGGAGGAAVGGKKGAAVGAAGGALYQHHRNKKEAKAAKQQ